MYVAAFDGGGTKTHCLIGDLNGNILGKGEAGPANYQTAGKKRSKESLELALNAALSNASIGKDKLIYYSFGLAGADDEYDIKNIKSFVNEITNETPYSIHHDSFIGLRSVSDENFGVVAICGTGAGFSGRDKKANEIQLRNQSYEIGNFGGGTDLSNEAMHYAFRSDEGSCKQSLLSIEIPKIFGVENLDRVSEIIRDNDYVVPEDKAKLIPPLLFELAKKGDDLSIDILNNMGTELGNYVLAVINKLDLDKKDELPIVLIGSIYKGDDKYLLDHMKKRIFDEVNNPKFIKPDLPPVYGAYYLALDKKEQLINNSL